MPNRAEITRQRNILCPQRANLIDVGVGPRSPDSASAFSRSMHAGRDSLLDQLPLKLSHGANDVHHEPTGGRAEVKVVAQGDESYAVGAQVLDRRDQVLQAAAEPVELPADDGIEGPRVCSGQHPV